MPHIVAILVTIMTLSCQSTTEPTVLLTNKLYPVIENGLWGYIDNSGTVVIEPKYHVAGQFSEGLAPVRLQGTYGYIDTLGDFIIEPQYDVAYPFDKGLAKVYLGSTPYYIDTLGEKIFEHNYFEVSGSGEMDFLLVQTKAENYGAFNRKGQMIADTLYKNITPLSKGIAIVSLLNPTSTQGSNQLTEYGVINNSGDFVVPLREYRSISPLKNGFAKVVFHTTQRDELTDHIGNEGVIDHSGKLRFIVPKNNWNLTKGDEHFSEGLATVVIFPSETNTANVADGNLRNTYRGAVDSDGQVLFSNKEWIAITKFKNNRAFVKDINGNWFLIDRTGRILNDDPFIEIDYSDGPEFLFLDGIHVVKTESGWCAIDTSGKIVNKSTDYDLTQFRTYTRGQIIFTEENVHLGKGEYYRQYGFFNTTSGIVIEPQFQDIDFIKDPGSLIYVKEDDRIGYLDHQGKYVWREEKKELQSLVGFNIDYKNWNYFKASSPNMVEIYGSGHYGGTGNDFKKISNSSKFESDALSILIDSVDKAKYEKYYKGVKMYIANTTQDTFTFDALFGLLELKITALDRDGIWKDIEYTESDWCGNSYHMLFLPPNHYWEIVIPAYEGSFETKLRAELKYSKYDQIRDDILYSNEYEGSINPGQFWRLTQPKPLGIGPHLTFKM